MRLWPSILIATSEKQAAEFAILQGLVTHQHDDCSAACEYLGRVLFRLCHGAQVDQSLQDDSPFAGTFSHPMKDNNGWVRATLEVALWAVAETSCFRDAVLKAVNIPGDTDTAGAVAGMLAGAAYGIESIPAEWRDVVHGAWPVRSDCVVRTDDICEMVRRVDARVR